MNYDIELNANDSSVIETQYAFTQGDYGQIQFSIRVKADGVYVTNAQRAYIVFTLPNGYIVTGADMSKSVATYTYPFQGSELQVAGTILADVKLVYTNGQISSNKFSFICRYDPLHDKSFEAGPYISQLQQIVNDGQAKIDYLQSLIGILQTDIGGTPVMRSDLHNTRDAVTAGQKAIDANMAQNILLRSDVTHQDEDNADKIVGADSLHAIKTDLQLQITEQNSNLNNNAVTSSGITLTWDAAVSAGGYTRIGKQIIVDIRIRTFTALTAGTTYSINGFPSPNYGAQNTVPVTCSTPYRIRNAYISPGGTLAFTPNIDIAADEVILFGAYYLTT